MSIVGLKYQCFSRAVFAYAQEFRKRPRCALIGACALIRTNTVGGATTVLDNNNNFK